MQRSSRQAVEQVSTTTTTASSFSVFCASVVYHLLLVVVSIVAPTASSSSSSRYFLWSRTRRRRTNCPSHYYCCFAAAASFLLLGLLFIARIPHNVQHHRHDDLSPSPRQCSSSFSSFSFCSEWGFDRRPVFTNEPQQQQTMVDAAAVSDASSTSSKLRGEGLGRRRQPRWHRSQRFFLSSSSADQPDGPPPFVLFALAIMSSADSLALAELYLNNGGTNWISDCTAGWSGGVSASTNFCDESGGDHSSFYGIDCDDQNGDVEKIDLGGCGLTGTLRPSFQAATFPLLEELHIENNALSGPLPSLANLAAPELLIKLHLDRNQFSTTLPSGWSRFIKLEELRVDRNQLTGSLPPQWASLVELKQLHASRNQLSGTLPPQYTALVKLVELELDSNQLSGTLPAAYGSNLVELVLLDLSNNQLTGTLPTGDWKAFAKLDYLWLSSNQLSGTLPADWNTWSGQVKQIHLGNNLLTGTLPASWGSTGDLKGALQELKLSGNKLSGTLPTAWEGLVQLRTLELASNQLVGSVPEGWSALSAQLRTLRLDQNQLNGTLPNAWRSLSQLRTLNVSFNFFTGMLPGLWPSGLTRILSTGECVRSCTGLVGPNGGGSCSFHEAYAASCFTVLVFYNCIDVENLPTDGTGGASWTWAYPNVNITPQQPPSQCSQQQAVPRTPSASKSISNEATQSAGTVTASAVRPSSSATVSGLWASKTSSISAEKATVSASASASLSSEQTATVRSTTGSPSASPSTSSELTASGPSAARTLTPPPTPSPSAATRSSDRSVTVSSDGRTASASAERSATATRPSLTRPSPSPSRSGNLTTATATESATATVNSSPSNNLTTITATTTLTKTPRTPTLSRTGPTKSRTSTVCSSDPLARWFDPTTATATTNNTSSNSSSSSSSSSFSSVYGIDGVVRFDSWDPNGTFRCISTDVILRRCFTLGVELQGFGWTLRAAVPSTPRQDGGLFVAGSYEVMMEVQKNLSVELLWSRNSSSLEEGAEEALGDDGSAAASSSSSSGSNHQPRGGVAKRMSSRRAIVRLCARADARSVKTGTLALGGQRGQDARLLVLATAFCEGDGTAQALPAVIDILPPPVPPREAAVMLQTAVTSIGAAGTAIRVVPALQRAGGGGCTSEVDEGLYPAPFDWFGYSGTVGGDAPLDVQHAAVLLGNLLLVGAVWAGLSFVGVVSAVGWSRYTWRESVQLVHVASLWAPFAAIVLVPMTTSSVVLLLWSGGVGSGSGSSSPPPTPSAGATALASVTVVLLAAYAVVLWQVGVVATRRLLAVPWSPKPKRVKRKKINALLPRAGEAAAAGEVGLVGASPSPPPERRWELYFREARWTPKAPVAHNRPFKRHFQLLLEDSSVWWYNSFDWLLGVVIGTVDGVGKALQTDESCRVSVVLGPLLLALQLVVLLAWRPLSSSIGHCSAVITVLFSVAVGLVQCILFLNSSSDGSQQQLGDVLAAALMIGGAPSMAKLALDVLSLLVAYYHILRRLDDDDNVEVIAVEVADTKPPPAAVEVAEPRVEDDEAVPPPPPPPPQPDDSDWVVVDDARQGEGDEDEEDPSLLPMYALKEQELDDDSEGLLGHLPGWLTAFSAASRRRGQTVARATTLALTSTVPLFFNNLLGGGGSNTNATTTAAAAAAAHPSSPSSPSLRSSRECLDDQEVQEEEDATIAVEEEEAAPSRSDGPPQPPQPQQPSSLSQPNDPHSPEDPIINGRGDNNNEGSEEEIAIPLQAEEEENENEEKENERDNEEDEDEGFEASLNASPPSSPTCRERQALL